jgi:hypothetical protein
MRAPAESSPLLNSSRMAMRVGWASAWNMSALNRRSVSCIDVYYHIRIYAGNEVSIRTGATAFGFGNWSGCRDAIDRNRTGFAHPPIQTLLVEASPGAPRACRICRPRTLPGWVVRLRIAVEVSGISHTSDMTPLRRKRSCWTSMPDDAKPYTYCKTDGFEVWANNIET